MLKRILRTFLWICGTLLGLSTLLAAFALLILLEPQWFISEKSLRWSAEHILKPRGINVSFAALEPGFSRDDFWRRNFTLSSRELKVSTESMDLHLPSFSLAFSLDIHPSRFALTALGPLDLIGGELALRSGPPEPESEEFKLAKKWIDQINALSFQPIHVQFNRFSLTPYEEQPIELQFDSRLTRPDPAGFWHLDLIAKDLKVPLSNVFAAIPEITAAVDFSIDRDRGLIVQTLGPLAIRAEEIRVTIAPPPAPSTVPPPEAKPSEGLGKWIEQLKALEIAPSTVVVKKLALIRTGQAPISAALELKLGQTEPQRMNLELSARAVKGIPLKQARLALHLKLPGGSEILPLNAQLQGRAELDKLGNASVDGSLFLASLQEGRYDLNARYTYGPSRFQAASNGSLKEGRFAIELKGQASELHERLKSVGVDRCKISGEIKEKVQPFLQSEVDCRVSLTRNPEPAEVNYEDILPRVASFDIRGPITIPAWNDDPRFTAPLSVTLVPMASDYFQLSSATKLDLSGRILGGAEGFKGTVDLDTSLIVPRFQKLVARFARTAYAVPAPFVTLDGLLRCDVKGRIRIQGTLVYMPYSCKSELDSSTQTVWIAANGRIETRANAKPLVQAQVDLSKVTFELPKISVDEPIPQLMPDKRIMEVKDASLTAASEPLPVELDLSFKTPDGRPLKLATHLTKVPIPISIDVTMKGDAPTTTGSVAVQQYDVAFFKKKAFIDHLAVKLNAAVDSPQLDGLIVFKEPDFRIDLKLSGTIDRPFYTFESKPSRTQSEIISIILYGSEADDLDEDSQRSVEDTRAAMVDGAIGLLSMYYLASTPIETVGYNPHTGIFRARVRLGQTLSLMVGSDLGGANQSIGFRKRLTENWSFETTAQTDEESKANHGIAMFRWGRRY